MGWLIKVSCQQLPSVRYCRLLVNPALCRVSWCHTWIIENKDNTICKNHSGGKKGCNHFCWHPDHGCVLHWILLLPFTNIFPAGKDGSLCNRGKVTSLGSIVTHVRATRSGNAREHSVLACFYASEPSLTSMKNIYIQKQQLHLFLGTARRR